MNTIHVCLATDNNYVQLAGVSISSILMHNNNVHIHILDCGIEDEHKNKLREYVNAKQSYIEFYDVQQSIESLKEKGINAQGRFSSYASYARFFIMDFISKSIEKILYIDCDTIISSSLKDLFDIDLKDNWVAGVIDMMPSYHKKEIGFDVNEPYYNSGVLMFNCNKCREVNLLENIITHISTENCVYSYHDQDVINIICRNHFLTLPPEYMVFLPEYSWGISGIKTVSLINERVYYSNKHLLYAAQHPIIIHYVESIFGRPWYLGSTDKSFLPWIRAKEISCYNDEYNYLHKKTSICHKLLQKSYYILPKRIFFLIYSRRKNKVLKKKEKRMKELRENG